MTKVKYVKLDDVKRISSELFEDRKSRDSIRASIRFARSVSCLPTKELEGNYNLTCPYCGEEEDISPSTNSCLGQFDPAPHICGECCEEYMVSRSATYKCFKESE